MDVNKRKELGAFLRSRRERISPDQYSLKSFSYRRTKGLRREEVAMLSGVSLSWYTWLEQGRNINVSKEVLKTISKTLMLSDEETRYLFELAEEMPPISSNTIEEDSILSFKSIIGSLDYYPAYINDDNWNTIAWNTAACAVFGDFNRMSDIERNTLWRMFTRASYKVNFRNWEVLAQTLLAQFRVAYGKNVNDLWYRQLIAGLSEKSSEFRAWWPDYNIAESKNGIKELFFPETGTFSLRHNSMNVVGQKGLCVTIYTPVSENDHEKMKELVQLFKRHNKAGGFCNEA